MTLFELHATVVLVCGQTEVATWPLTGEGRPDLSAVDALARLELAAKRMGCSIVVREAHAELCDLLELAGLADLLEGARKPSCGLQVGGQAEGGEELRVEEVVVPDDPVA